MYTYTWASLEDQTMKNLPAVHKTWVRSLSWEDPLEKGMTTYSSILVWKNPMDRGSCQATVHGATESQTTETNTTHKYRHVHEQDI